MPQRPQQQRSSSGGPDGSFWLPVCLLFGMLLAYSFWRVPIPGVNEPHYLGKAKHLWNPAWGSGDLFLESSRPHFVFYVTLGWLTRITTLETVAVLGRCLGLLVLAIGWRRISVSLTGHAWGSVPALSLFLLLQSLGNWSGEWLVGGIESKVISYGFLFWGIGAFLDRRLREAACATGLAVSFHPIVGIWGVLAMALTTILTVRVRNSWQNENTPTPREWGLAAILLVTTSLPGLIPAAMTVAVSNPELERAANLLQVANRLAHHLDPMRFPASAYLYFGLLIVTWLLLMMFRVIPGRTSAFRSTPPRENDATPDAIPGDASAACDRDWRMYWWVSLVLVTLLIAAVGVMIGWGPRPMKTMPGYEWRVRLLKFYPFRLADLMVPVAIAMEIAQRMQTWSATNATSAPPLTEGTATRQRTAGYAWRPIAVALFTGISLFAALRIPGPDQNPSRMSTPQQADWIDVLSWIDRRTSPSALIYSVDDNWAVKWYAQRPEYVNYKDAPQDAPSLYEWNRRLWVMARWKRSAMSDGIVQDQELADLHATTGIDYLICRRFGPFAGQPVYENSTFRVYTTDP